MHLARRKARKKLWEIPENFHCGIIGSCLTLPELRKLYRKLWNKDVRGLSDYEFHSTFVSNASEAILPTRQLQRLLETKYKRTVERHSRLSGSDQLARESRAVRLCLAGSADAFACLRKQRIERIAGVLTMSTAWVSSRISWRA